MAALIGEVVFYGLAAALAAPVAAVVTALILGRSNRPVPSAIVFTAGAASLDVVVAVLFLWALGDSLNLRRRRGRLPRRRPRSHLRRSRIQDDLLEGLSGCRRRPSRAR